MVYKAELWTERNGYWESVVSEYIIAKTHEHAKELLGDDYKHTKVIVKSTGISEPNFTLEEYPYWDFEGYKAFMSGIEV